MVQEKCIKIVANFDSKKGVNFAPLGGAYGKTIKRRPESMHTKLEYIKIQVFAKYHKKPYQLKVAHHKLKELLAVVLKKAYTCNIVPSLEV